MILYFSVIGGCMDTIARNYNVLATYDDGCGYILVVWILQLSIMIH